MADPQIQVLDLTLMGGEAQNSDERAGDGLLLAQDIVYRRRGGIVSRLGQDPLAPTMRPSGYNPTGTRRDALIVRDDSLALVEGSVVRPYADDILPDGEIGGVGLASAYYVELDPLEGSTTAQLGLQVAVSGTGYMAAAWLEKVGGGGGQVNVLVELFSEEGSTLIPTKTVYAAGNGAACPQIAYVGGVFLVTWAEASFNFAVRGAVFDPVTGVIGPPVTLLPTQTSQSYNYRAAAHSDGTSLIVIGGAPNGADPFTKTEVRFFSNALALLNPVPFFLTQRGPTPLTAHCFGIYTETPSRVWFSIGYSQNPAAGPPVVNVGDVVLVNGTNPAAPTQTWQQDVYTETQTTGTQYTEYLFATSVIETSATEGVAAFSRLEHNVASPISSDPSVVFYRVSDGFNLTLCWAFGCILESDLWKHTSGSVFCEVIESASLAQDAFGIIPALGAAHIVAATQPATAANSGTTALDQRPCQVHATFAIGQVPPPIARTAFSPYEGNRNKSNQAQIVRLLSGEVTTIVYAKQSGSAPAVPRLVRASEVTARSHAELQGIVLLSGGTPTLFDGQSATEYGFQHVPKIESVTSTGAGLIDNGAYLYATEYQWISGTGAILHSLVDVSDLYTVAAGPKTNTVRVRLPQLSHKPDRKESIGRDFAAIAVVLYRTIAGSTGPFYRLTAISVPFTQLGDYGVQSLDIVDNYPDLGGANGPLATFPQIYTSGGVLQAFPAPSCRLVTTWLGRFVLAGTDDDSIYFSVEAVAGEVPYFSPALRAQPFEGGRVTGLAVLDDKLIVLKERSVYVMAGQLPDQRGLNGTIPSPTTIATDSGCMDPYSVVVAPTGVFFRSERGIQLLDRGLNLSFIGENVALDIEQAGPVVAPLLVPAQTQVRFDAPLAGAEGSGPIVVFDYLMGAWTRWLVDKGNVPQGRVPVASAALKGRPYWLDGLGTLWRERRGRYHDSDALRPLTYRWRSTWMTPGGLSGYFKTQAVHVLGAWGFPHILTVNVFVDFDDAAPACTTAFPVPANPSAGYEFRASVTSARAARVQACSVELVVSWDGASVAEPDAVAATISGVALEILPIGGGQRRIPATQKG